MGLNIRLIGLVGLVLGLADIAITASNKNGSVMVERIIYNCSRNEFKCSIDNKCIPLLKVQDGTMDCIDGSDEGIYNFLFFMMISFFS
ncbi:unnamed protein product [Onchocerca flexuosa]|uniref:Low-density lipoprotein receptor domain class A n=1 Tax=Onchocerca flexuosa TaxID=387005 RepID=A0A183HX88_9BILA|nr:unnamed protein product [Onchocerca flexuosa]